MNVVIQKIKCPTEISAFQALDAFKALDIKAKKLNKLVLVDCDKTEDFEKIRINVAQGVLCDVDVFDKKYFWGGEL